MKIKNCCPHVEPAKIDVSTPENFIVGFFCAKCGVFERAENVRPSQKNKVYGVLTENWNKRVEQNKADIRKQINKIVGP